MGKCLQISVTSWALVGPAISQASLASGCCCSRDAEPGFWNHCNLAADGSLTEEAWKLYPHECRRKPLAGEAVHSQSEICSAPP
jgi:hypothetical protein